MSDRPGYMNSKVVGCQFSVYPLRQTDIGPPIEEAIAAARAEGCSVRVGNLSTLLWGSEEQVFDALRAAFRGAQHYGSSVVMATLVAGMPTDELVGSIQARVDGGANSEPLRTVEKATQPRAPEASPTAAKAGPPKAAPVEAAPATPEGAGPVAGVEAPRSTPVTADDALFGGGDEC